MRECWECGSSLNAPCQTTVLVVGRAWKQTRMWCSLAVNVYTIGLLPQKPGRDVNCHMTANLTRAGRSVASCGVKWGYTLL